MHRKRDYGGPEYTHEPPEETACLDRGSFDNPELCSPFCSELVLNSDIHHCGRILVGIAEIEGGLNRYEIAECLGISHVSVDNIANRALEKLSKKKELKEYYEGDDGRIHLIPVPFNGWNN